MKKEKELRKCSCCKELQEEVKELQKKVKELQEEVAILTVAEDTASEKLRQITKMFHF